jgi:hypothetical protein
MMKLGVEPDLFVALRAGFEAGATGDTPPINTPQFGRVRSALAGAVAAALPHRSVIVILESVGDLYALGDCFAVGGEGHPRVTELQWHAINELVDQAAASG